MSSRAGTVVILAAWVASWGLAWVHLAFVFLPAVGAPILLYCALASRLDALDWRRKEVSVFLPLSREAVWHNRRARLVRRRDELRKKKRACEVLMDKCHEPHELTRVPVLVAERDAAHRALVMLFEDIQRLEAAWELEDRERDYRRLSA